MPIQRPAPGCLLMTGDSVDYKGIHRVWSSLVSGDTLMQRLSDDATLARPCVRKGETVKSRSLRTRGQAGGEAVKTHKGEFLLPLRQQGHCFRSADIRTPGLCSVSRTCMWSTGSQP